MTDKNNEVTFDALDRQIKEAEIKKSLLLRDSMYSNDPSEIMKAQSYMSNQKAPKQDPKAYFFPLDYSYRDGLDYKEIVTSVPDNVLRRVGRIHVIESIINTKINQIKDFMCFTTDDQKVGYTIRRKESLFTDKNDKKELTTQEKKKIEYIVEFLENGGENAKWDIHDDLHSFTDKIMRDSYTFNRSTFECERTLSDRLIKFIPVDAMTVRLLPTIDPWYKARNPDSKFIEKKGYLPRYCQIFNSQIVVNEITNEQIVWYPWELAFETRNKSTDIFRNGYGVSEIEILSQILTWILYGFQYNGNFFSQGSNPKGLLNIKSGDGGGQGMLNQLRQLWTSSVSGIDNSHRMPVVEGMDLEFIDMHHSNKDMEFDMWIETLIVLTCSVMVIDPSELGFNFKKQAQIFGQDGQKERLNHSKEKGLKPALIFLQKMINKYIVSELDDKFEFVFTGVDIEDETQYIDNDKKKIEMGAVSLEDIFEKYSGRKLDPEKDTILNPVYLQSKQMAMYGGDQSNQAVDQEFGGEDEGAQNPFADYESEDNTQKSQETDPITKAAQDWIKNRFNR